MNANWYDMQQDAITDAEYDEMRREAESGPRMLVNAFMAALVCIAALLAVL